MCVSPGLYDSDMGLAKSKGRAAGDDPFYTFQAEGCPDILLPSVTSIIKNVFSPVFQPAAYWGAKQAIQYMFEGSHEERRTDEIEEAYVGFKASEFAPNAARDKGASRGTAAHDRLEAWANGLPVPATDIGYEKAVDAWWLGQSQTYTPMLVERVLFWIPDEWYTRSRKMVTYRLRNHPDICFDADPAYADDIMRTGYAGTTDLFRVTNHGRRVDGMDLKTHKPPVRFEDHLQVAAYGKAAIQMGLILEKEWTTNTIVLAKENGKFKEEERWVDPDVFTQVRSVYQAMEGVA